MIGGYRRCKATGWLPHAGCNFQDLWATSSGSAVTIGRRSATDASLLSFVSLVNSTIGAVSDARPFDPTPLDTRTGYVYFDGPGQARLENTVFEDMLIERPFVSSNSNQQAAVFIDSAAPMPVVSGVEGVPRETFPLEGTAAVQPGAFLQADDPARLNLDAVRSALLLRLVTATCMCAAPPPCRRDLSCRRMQPPGYLSMWRSPQCCMWLRP